MQGVISLLLSGDSPYDLVPDAGSGPAPGPSEAPGSPAAGLVGPPPPRLAPGGTASDPTSTALPATPGPGDSTRVLTPRFSATRSSGRRTRPVDWRQWLDVVDEAGLVPAGVANLTFAEDLLVTTGVIRRRSVRTRADARAAFHRLRALAPAGITPVVVRRGMDRWDFEDASRDMRLAAPIAMRLAGLPAADAEPLWAAYEAARSRAALRRLRDRLP
jgi:hypothetical protein